MSSAKALIPTLSVEVPAKQLSAGRANPPSDLGNSSPCFLFCRVTRADVFFPNRVSLEGSNSGKQEGVSQNDPTGGPALGPMLVPR